MLFYRCTICHRVVSKWDIDKYSACGKCGNPRISPTNLTLWERIVQIAKHPAVWKWN